MAAEFVLTGTKGHYSAKWETPRESPQQLHFFRRLCLRLNNVSVPADCSDGFSLK